MSMEWHRVTTALGCQVCPHLDQECDGVVDAHHVLYAQFIRSYVESFAHRNYLDEAEKNEMMQRLLWDLRDGMAVCYRAHRRHHNRTQPIPYRLIPASAIEFAVELGLGHRLDALYPADVSDRLTA